ncbi:amino acid transporter [Peribacillus sp. B2I2]
MKKNYTVFFLLLFIVAISSGMALKNHFDYSMIIGVGLATIFLLASAFSLGKRNRENNSHN